MKKESEASRSKCRRAETGVYNTYIHTHEWRAEKAGGRGGRERAAKEQRRGERGTTTRTTRTTVVVVVTFRIEKPRNAILALRDVEHTVEPLSWLAGTGVPPIDQVRSVSMDQRAESQSIPPRPGEVRDAHSGIARRRSSGPS